MISSSGNSMSWAAKKNVVEVIQVRGWVWEPPPDIAEALGDPRLSDCLLFHLHRLLYEQRGIFGYFKTELTGIERWEHKYRIVKEMKKEEYRSTHADEIMSDRRVLFVEEVKYYTENIDDNIEVGVSMRNASSNDDADDVVQITLPATHLILLSTVDLMSMREVVKRLNLESIVTLGLPAKLLFTVSDQLLDSPPSQCKNLFIMWVAFRFVGDLPEDEGELFVERVVGMCLSLHLEGLVLHSVYSSTWDKIIGRLSTSQSSQLAYLGSKTLEGHPSTGALSGLKQFHVMGGQVKFSKSELAASATSLQRLDLRGCWSMSSEDIEFLLGSITTSHHDTPTSLSDLGLPIHSIDTMKLLVTSPALAKLLILRLSIYLDEDEGKAAMNQLAQDGLSRSDCKVRFLDLALSTPIPSEWKLSANFWHLLRDSISSRKTNLIQGLRIYPQSCVQVRGGLADWLRSPACSLVWLDCIFITDIKDTFANEKEEWELANALNSNFSVCTLSVQWKSLAAKAHASSLIRRNQVYKAGQLLEDEQVKPKAAKLFLCGHGTVGKTTLCRTLLRTQKRSVSSVIASPLATCGLLGSPDRTRGMEFHSLSFGKERRLVICDLAGQDEFHAFHHYFMNASNNDLFIVVCKLEKRNSQDVFERQLEYWLRFIVSHRSTTDDAAPESSTSYKPKVIVAVNFFYSAPPEDMCSIAIDRTHAIMEKFSTKLDFGSNIVQEAGDTHVIMSYTNLFAINALQIGQVRLLRKRLKSLLEELLQSGHLILKLCNDISTKVLPSFTRKPNFLSLCLNRSALDQETAPLFLPFSKVLERYHQMFPIHIPPNIAQRIEAALMELHNEGMLVYFPRPREKKSNVGIEDESATHEEYAGNLVITDSGWFCNKLIGNLLGANLQSSGSWPPTYHRRSTNDYPKWLWKIQDIKQMLRNQDCKEEHLEKIIRYLEDLDLCFTTQGDTTQAKGESLNMILFPALLKVKEIQYPKVVSTMESYGAGSHMQEVFFGRRLRCEESSMHLIPSGVFTRLQVRLQRLCDNNAYALGNGWASLMKGNVGAVVRFGGERDEFWENKQWVDILIFIPNSHEESHNSMLAGEHLMTEIKSLIYEICQAADFRGIPTVMLQEWVLQSKDLSSPAIQLTTILKQVREEKYHVTWPDRVDIPGTPVKELLFPMEVEEQVKSLFMALEKIRWEFSLTADGDEKMAASDHEGNLSTSDLAGGVMRVDKGKGIVIGSESEDIGTNVLPTREWFVKEFESFGKRFDGRFESLGKRLDRRFDNLEEGMQMIRKDITSLGECLRGAERNIIVNCSTRLLRHELKKDRAHPLYPYLVDSEGKLKALKSLFGQHARLHFMCESPTDGPHPVEGQKGKEVTIRLEKWLIQTARVMVPAFRVLCCLARLAATVYLPSAHVFIPTPDCFDALGLERQALQHVILPKALDLLLDGVPNIDPRRLEGSMIQQNEVKEAIKGILENDESIDMATHFSLHRVSFNGGEQVCWVCDRHTGAGDVVLQPISNPFK